MQRHAETGHFNFNRGREFASESYLSTCCCLSCASPRLSTPFGSTPYSLLTPPTYTTLHACSIWPSQVHFHQPVVVIECSHVRRGGSRGNRRRQGPGLVRRRMTAPDERAPPRAESDQVRDGSKKEKKHPQSFRGRYPQQNSPNPFVPFSSRAYPHLSPQWLSIWSNVPGSIAHLPPEVK